MVTMKREDNALAWWAPALDKGRFEIDGTQYVDSNERNM